MKFLLQIMEVNSTIDRILSLYEKGIINDSGTILNNALYRLEPPKPREEGLFPLQVIDKLWKGKDLFQLQGIVWRKRFRHQNSEKKN